MEHLLGPLRCVVLCPTKKLITTRMAKRKKHLHSARAKQEISRGMDEKNCGDSNSISKLWSPSSCKMNGLHNDCYRLREHSMGSFRALLSHRKHFIQTETINQLEAHNLSFHFLRPSSAHFRLNVRVQPNGLSSTKRAQDLWFRC